MSKHNPTKAREWYLKNRERLLPIRRAYNKKWRESQHGRDFDKERNASPERRAYRKNYKQTEAGRRSNLKYRRKPEIKEKYEEYRVRIRYGITKETFWKMVSDQEGKCAICNNPNGGKLTIDHDHKSGDVRGLLCGNCNRGIGLFRDNPSYLIQASEYLQKNVHKDNGNRETI